MTHSARHCFTPNACFISPPFPLYCVVGNNEVIMRALELFHRGRLIVISRAMEASAFYTKMDITNYHWTGDSATFPTAAKFALQHWSRKLRATFDDPRSLSTPETNNNAQVDSSFQPTVPATPVAVKPASSLPLRILLLYTAWTAVVPFSLNVLREAFNTPQTFNSTV